MDLSLANRNALVCGSSQGIGLATAIELAHFGANITLVARDQSRLDDALIQLPALDSQKHSTLVCDFSQPDRLKSAVQLHLDQTGTVSILINNTGGPPGGDIIDADASAFIDAYTKHLICNHVLTQLVVPGMKAQNYGRIVNIISTSVKQPIPGLGVSNTTRGAVASWAKTMASELAGFGITVNNVLPGFTDTQRLRSLFQARADSSGKTFEQVAEAMKQTIPAARFAEPHEVGAAAAFLCTPAAAYINGINVPVDGGRTGCL
jgi:3-oxoacyl-[acyl-carrier protein] reductase